ncbi:MAG TPA: hypothetical protein VGP07_03810 [Polyangia bacterium]|jgi:hypothetical protein
MPDLSLQIPMMAPRVTATLEQTHVTVKVTPNNPLFAYQLTVPKGWAFSEQFGPVPTAPFEPQGMGFFAVSAESDAPVIAVTVTSIPFEVPIDTWARLVFAAEGWTIVSAKWFPGAMGPFFDVTGTRVRAGVEEVRRSSLRVDGSHLFSVNCLSGRAHWDQAKELFWVAHDTFKLSKGTGLTRMEPWLSAQGADPAFEVAYPISWSATPVEGAPEGVAAVDIKLLNARQDTLLAYVQVKVQRLEENEAIPPVDQLASKALGKLSGVGFAAMGAPVPLSDEDDPRAAAVPGWLGGFLAKGQMGSSEVTARMGFAQRPDLLVTWLLLSPTVHDDTLVALRAQRAFEMARSALRFD